MNETYHHMGESHILIQFDGEISIKLLMKIKATVDAVSPHVIECIPAYNSIMIMYDPLAIAYDDMVLKLSHIIKHSKAYDNLKATTHVVDVVYGGEDLHRVAKHNHISEQKVISLHTDGEYTVYMLGFMPGFCYLGGLNKHIATPRLDVPRQRIPKGSVGIAGQQTGVYPMDSPGGWNIIGHTDFEFFTHTDPPCDIEIGDKILFRKV